MNGFTLCLVVLLTGNAVFGQLPPTRTRKGTRPPGRTYAQPSPVAAPLSPTMLYSPMPAPAPAPLAPYVPPVRQPVQQQTFLPAAQPQQYIPPPQAPIQPQYVPPVQQPLPPQMPPQQIPPQMPPQQMPPQLPPTPVQQPFNFFNLFAPTPAQPAPQVMTCAQMCVTAGFNQVCSVFGTTFQNDCYRQCSQEPYACNGPCPCEVPAQQPMYHTVNECAYCRDPFTFGEDYSPVCVDDDKTLYNECEARCKGKTIKCTQACPC